MDLEELRCFLAVVEQGSVMAASLELGVPRGTLRRRIDELEARAGVSLLVRSARGVVATDAGIVLARRGRGLLADGAALLAAVRELGREPRELLRLRLPADSPPPLVAKIVDVIRPRGSRLRIELQMRDNPLDGGLNDADLIFHGDDGDSANSWQLITLARIPLQIMASRLYLRRAGCPETVEELDKHELLSWTYVQPADRWPLRAGGFIEVEPSMSSNQSTVVDFMAHAHMGLALLPNVPMARFGLPKTELVPVLPDVVGRDLALNVSLPKTGEGSLMPSRVVELIQDYLAKAGLERP